MCLSLGVLAGRARPALGATRLRAGKPGVTWRLEGAARGTGCGDECPRCHLFSRQLCGHGYVPEGGKDWRGHLWGGIQGQEHADRAARGSQEDQAGPVSAGTAPETPHPEVTPRPELPHPSLISGFYIQLLPRMLPSYTGAPTRCSPHSSSPQPGFAPGAWW